MYVSLIVLNLFIILAPQYPQQQPVVYYQQQQPATYVVQPPAPNVVVVRDNFYDPGMGKMAMGKK